MIHRLYVEKKPEYRDEADALLKDFRENLGIKSLKDLRILNRYDISGISHEDLQKSFEVFSLPPADILYVEDFDLSSADKAFAVSSSPCQYDQRSDSAEKALKLILGRDGARVRYAKVVLLNGALDADEFKRIKNYYINPLELSEVSLAKVQTFEGKEDEPCEIKYARGFTDLDDYQIKAFIESEGLAMNKEDLILCREYFKNVEKRDPTVTELRVIDTYWSDHCRHTTFMTSIDEIEIQDGPYSDMIRNAFAEYLCSREKVHCGKGRDICLMDLATINMKELRLEGGLKDLEISEEVNACSITVNALIDGKPEEWLVMFKNETHNHPTEMEPFGGASTCLGGAIRDPLSGRSYVYGAIRITGSGDPRQKVEDTLPGKLPQRTITTKAAQGYSSYGNQIGVAGGQVAEIYDPGYIAKRMELGAVIGAAPKVNVSRQSPSPGDVVLLVGGRTGRDGCGGATGSSKEHHEDSLLTSSAEVQKGNPPIERNIQRLFRKPEVSRLIKKCNDFGAGGVSVAVGELSPGLLIDLDAVPVKYPGLDATELAISESQERMAVVTAPENAEIFIEEALIENLEATPIAKVAGDNRLTMLWRGKKAMDISRDFLDTNGARRHTKVTVSSPEKIHLDFSHRGKALEKTMSDLWYDNLRDINVASQRGLSEGFDSSAGALTVLMPLGGKYQVTPQEGLAMKLPALRGETSTATIMTYGYNPKLSRQSPFHGAMYSVVDAAAKIVALGGDYSSTKLSLQEYFERLGDDPQRWGKPFAALLGAFHAQKHLGIASIGGKDSMSGTFMDLNVPPTLVAFAVNSLPAETIVSREIKGENSAVLLVGPAAEPSGGIDFEVLKQSFGVITGLIRRGQILSASSIVHGGIARAISECCFGNGIGFKFDVPLSPDELFNPKIGQLLIEIDKQFDFEAELEDIPFKVLGHTQAKPFIEIGDESLDIFTLRSEWESPLESVFPATIKADLNNNEMKPSCKVESPFVQRRKPNKSAPNIGKPKVFIPVFPGTHGEYELARAFEAEGASAETLVLQNITPDLLKESLWKMAQGISSCQILAIPAGASLGDEPEGAGKYIAAAFKIPCVKEAVLTLLEQKDGLILGIANGFQALLQLGLLPFGEYKELTDMSASLTLNKLGRNISRYVSIKTVSNLSPWFYETNPDNVTNLPISHAYGRFGANENLIEAMAKNRQIATQYVDFGGNPTMDPAHNPYGSLCAIEGITSPDGRILGRMAHSERTGAYLGINIPGEKTSQIFKAGIRYFR